MPETIRRPKTEAAEALQALSASGNRWTRRVRQVEELVSWRLADRRLRTHELVQDYANHLKDPMAKLPAPADWSGWEAYFHIMEYEGDRSVDVK